MILIPPAAEEEAVSPAVAAEEDSPAAEAAAAIPAEVECASDMVSIIVPCYNEGEHIYDNLSVISETLKETGVSYEILAVNDGSKDNTWEEIKRAESFIDGVRDCGYEKNRGKGGAILHGIECSTGDIVGFIDADLELPASLLPGFISKMNEGCDVVIGSKMHQESQVHYPALRKFVSWGYYIMLKILFGLKCKDTQTGIKLYKGDLIRAIGKVQQINSYAFDIEQLALANSKKAKIAEMPVEVHYTREGSFSRISLGTIIGMFFDTIKIWWDLRIRKKYSF